MAKIFEAIESGRMQTVAIRSPFPGLRSSLLGHRSLSSEVSASQPRGGRPRFHSQLLPSSKGDVVWVQGDEFWHMTRVLRLRVNDRSWTKGTRECGTVRAVHPGITIRTREENIIRVELFNGAGGIVEGCIQRVDRTGLDVMALEEPKVVAPEGIQWHVFAAFGTLKGGRADWLVEKCTELGASSVTPLLTERSPTITENRLDRLQRIVLAAIKQCQRLHEMTVNPPIKFHSILPIVAHSNLSFLAAAEATPLINVLTMSSVDTKGLMIVGPEGDFTEEEVKLVIEAGATPVGLGPCRLRVETATVALLSTLMLWSDAHKLERAPAAMKCV